MKNHVSKIDRQMVTEYEIEQDEGERKENLLHSKTTPTPPSKTHEILGFQLWIVEPALRYECKWLRKDGGIGMMKIH